MYQRDDLMDPNKVDPKTRRTNRELMKSGRSPKGPDRKSTEVHHMTQRNESTIAEETNTFHNKNHKTI